MPRPPVRAQHRGPPAGSPRAARRQQPRLQVSSNARDQLVQKLADKSVGTRPEDSDDSDHLVTRGPGGRRGRFNPIQEIYASGAVGAGDKPGAHPTRAQRMKSIAKALKSPRPSSSVSQAPVDRPVNGRVSESPTANGVLATARTTPARDVSILEGFKLRKRQLSVLHVAPLDSSTLNFNDDSFALPDDESTPAQVPARQLPNGTPLSSDSTPRKRKLGSSEPLSPSHQRGTPSLISDTHASGQKRRRQTPDGDEVDDDERDIMAPPLSSSSSSSSVSSASPPASSPAKPISSNSLRKPLRPSSATTRNPTATTTAAASTTQQLQALMPSKRHRARRIRANTSEFDIPSDASSDPVGEADESFLPLTKKRGKRLPKKPPPKSSSSSLSSLTLPSKATAPRPNSKSKSTSKSKPKSERALQPTRASRTNIKAIATTSTSTSTTTAASSFLPVSSKQRGPFLGGRKQPDASSSPPSPPHSSREARERRIRQSGGSRLGSCISVSDNTNNDDAIAGKENTPLESVLYSGGGGGGGSDGSKAAVISGENKSKNMNKWDEIDAFDLQFEDVSVYDRSSEGDAR